GRTRGLDDEDVGPAHVVLDLEPHLAVAEAGEMGAAEGHSQAAADGLPQGGMGAAGEYSQLSSHRSLARSESSLARQTAGCSAAPQDPRSLEVNPRSLVKLGGAPQPPRPPWPLLLPVMDGWGGRIRTFVYGVQSPAPYRLATPQPETTSEALRTAEPARSPTGSRPRRRSPGRSRPEPRLRRRRPETTAAPPPAAGRPRAPSPPGIGASGC